jgi:hypothetical protein
MDPRVVLHDSYNKNILRCSAIKSTTCKLLHHKSCSNFHRSRHPGTFTHPPCHRQTPTSKTTLRRATPQTHQAHRPTRRLLSCAQTHHPQCTAPHQQATALSSNAPKPLPAPKTPPQQHPTSPALFPPAKQAQTRFRAPSLKTPTPQTTLDQASSDESPP